MKVVKIILGVFLIVSLCMGMVMASDLGACKANVLNLANAASVWANDHYNKYPTAGEFLGQDFMVYVKKVGGNADSFYSPANGLGLRYEIRSDLKYFAIFVPDAEKYGCKNFYFSTKSGLIIKK